MVKQLLGLILITLLAACGGGETDSTAEEPSTPETTAEAPTTAPTEALAPGTYCYTIADANQTGAMRLTLDKTAQLLGDSSIAIHSAEADYYSSYTQTIVGQLSGNTADVDVTTWIEGDRQIGPETWTVTAETLTLPNDTLLAADCSDEAVVSQFAEYYDDVEADAILDTVADQAGERVQFDPGTSGTTLENSVIRGERDLYLLGAQAGQLMTLDLYALEDNAVFDLISPSGSLLAHESTYEVLTLPEAGDYQIIVGGTRGNATYALDVGIE
jgi:hypothetical protein